VSWLKKRYPELVMLWIAGGFFALALELLITRHTEEVQLVGVAAALLGGAVAVLALFLRGLRTLWLVGFAVVALAGLVGTGVHWSEAGEEGGYAGGYYEDDDEYEDDEGEEGAPPPLAPLGLTGLAVLGAATLYVRDEEAEEG